MQKYISFFRLRFIFSLQYRAAALAGVITQFVWGAMEILMFTAFYKADAGAFPMEFSALSSYVWMQQAFLALYMTWYLENDIFDLIQNGNIAYELCRPVDLYSMWYTRSMAGRLAKTLLRCIPILVIASFLPKPYGMILPNNMITLLWFLITMILAFLIVVAFCMLIYGITFYTISPMGVRMVAVTIVEFFSGAVIPLPFLPDGIRRIVELLPFASMQNVPLRIYSSDLAGDSIFIAVGLQIFWLVVLFAAGKLLFHKALKKVTVLGG
jgi:ABC-2 type transport system permease protein